MEASQANHQGQGGAREDRGAKEEAGMRGRALGLSPAEESELQLADPRKSLVGSELDAKLRVVLVQCI